MNKLTIFTLLAAIVPAATIQAQKTEPSETLMVQPQETDSLALQLHEIVVTAKQPATRLVGTTLVSTIAGTALSEAGTALDALAQLPMIKVEDNTLSIIGRTNPEVYIDGRPIHDERELQQLLSANIRKVELIMAPGATYSSTTDAVLKITTRQNFAEGISLTEQLHLRQRRRFSASDFLDLNYRSGSWDFFVNGSVNRDETLTKGSTTNTLVYDGRQTIVGSRQHNLNKASAGILKAGLNYSKDGQSFGAYYRFNPERGDFSNSGAEWLDSSDAIADLIHKDTRAHSHLVSAYYETRFSSEYLIHFDGDFRQSDADNSTSTSYPDGNNAEVRATDKIKSTLWAGKLYMNLPIWNGGLTIGTQDSYTRQSIDYRMLNAEVESYIPSSFSDARQTNAALFASWAGQIGKTSLSLGARYEYSDYDFKVDGKRNEDVSRRHHLLTPDISLSYLFNDYSQLSFSYKQATVKPPYSQLTGSLTYVGLNQIEGGNPALRNEKMHDFQIFGMYKNLMFQADLTRSIDTYAYVKQLYPANNLQLLMHPINIDVTALSCFLVWSKPVRRWTPNITIGIYQQWLDIEQTKYDKPIVSYYFDNTFSFPHGWLITANISGSTRGDMHTNCLGATAFTMNASVGKTFLNKSLTIKLSATDIFNSANNDWTMNTYGIFVDKRQNYDRRGVTLNIIYNLHPRKSKYKGKAASEEELRRL